MLDNFAALQAQMGAFRRRGGLKADFRKHGPKVVHNGRSTHLSDRP